MPCTSFPNRVFLATFRTLRREFVDAVMNSPLYRASRMKCFADGSLLMVRSFDGCLINVMQPSKLSLKQLPLPDSTAHGPDICLDCFPVGMMAMDESTEECTVCIASHFRSWVDVNQSGPGDFEVPTKNLHLYHSATNTWSILGTEGIDQSEIRTEGQRVVGVVRHRARYTALVASKPYKEKQVGLLVYRDESRKWEAVAADFQSLFREVGAHAGDDILFFHHKGILYIAIAALCGCWLWEYRDERSKWHVKFAFGSCLRWSGLGKVDSARCFEFLRGPYAQVLGDFLHFGVFVPEKTRHFSKPCQRMTYNLITEKFEKFWCDETRNMVVSDNLDSEEILLQLA